MYKALLSFTVYKTKIENIQEYPNDWKLQKKNFVAYNKIGCKNVCWEQGNIKELRKYEKKEFHLLQPK